MLYRVSKEGLLREFGALKLSAAAVQILQGKSELLPYKITQLRTPAANILKQEMLAAGGDCAVPPGCILCAEDRVDALLLGTLKHYRILLYKLSQMPYFGLDKLAVSLTELLSPQPKRTVLADGRVLSYERLQVMGILNVTPDSFYAGSRCKAETSLLQKAEKMLQEGAALLDVGGQSTRPGSSSITAAEECSRVLPALKALKQHFPDSIVSIDTYHAATAQAALEDGADLINDISALEADAEMVKVVCRSQAPVILMHMRGTPATMGSLCQYQDVVGEVAEYLQQRAAALEQLGLGRDKVILDPGLGFAKDVEQNLLLLQNLESLTGTKYPVLLAASRKGTIGKVLGNLPPEERLEGTLATTARAVAAGVSLVRVHDVQANLRLARMLEAIQAASAPATALDASS